MVFQTNRYTKGGVGGNVADAQIADPESSDTDGTILITIDGGAGTYTLAYGTTSHTFTARAPAAQQVVGIAIASLMPNPVGNERQLEEATLRNGGTTGLSLDGWTPRDAGARIWNLAGLGTLDAGAQATIQRAGMPMSLNNGGDTIELINAAGTIVQTVTYGSADDNEICTVQTDNSVVCQ